MTSGTVVAAMVFATMFAGIKGSQAEDYSTGVVRSLLAMPEGISAGFSEKQLHRLGDRLAIAIIKLHDPEELIDPRNVRRFLPLLKDAFAHPDLIQSPLDERAQVTVLLLDYLSRKTPDWQLQVEAAQLAIALQPEG